jgi:hypothetical protein
MNLPTESQWARYSALCVRLRSVPAPERTAALQALRAQGDEDPQVLSLVAVHFALPPTQTGSARGSMWASVPWRSPWGRGVWG